MLKHLTTALLFCIYLTACGAPEEELATARQDFAASCTSGNPFTMQYPSRPVGCRWQPTNTIIPIPPHTQFCTPGFVPDNRIDIFDGPFVGGMPPYNIYDCARIVVEPGVGTQFSYQAVLAAGWLRPDRWIKSFTAGGHVQAFQFSTTPCLNCGVGVGNGGFPFLIGDINAMFGQSMQIAVMAAQQMVP